MNETEFTHIAVELRTAAAQAASTAGLGAAECEDVAQDTMLRLWTLRVRLTSAVHAQAMAVVVARNLARDVQRAKPVMPLSATVIRTHAQTSLPADAAMETVENDEWLERRLAALPSLQYQILHLRQVEGKSNGEIAAILGTTPGTVSTLLSRARKILLEEIKKKHII